MVQPYTCERPTPLPWFLSDTEMATKEVYQQGVSSSAIGLADHRPRLYGSGWWWCHRCELCGIKQGDEVVLIGSLGTV
ncbi:MAG: hypothetical protein ACLR1V_10250 [Coprococcus sp.]